MFRFSVGWLFGFTLLVALLLMAARVNTLLAYLLSCLSIGWYFATLSRFTLRANNEQSVIAALLTASATGSLLLASGAFYGTFVKPSVGILVGGGWGSVLAASVVGAAFGLFTGPFAAGMYFLTVAIVPRRGDRVE